MNGHLVRSSDTVVVIGAGAFALSFIQAFVQSVRTPVRVVAVGRSEPRLAELTELVRKRISSPGIVAFRPAVADIGLKADFRLLFARLRPRIVVVCSSLQSPYEAMTCKHDWARILGSVEFGLTAVLQAAVAVKAAEAVAANDLRQCRLINCCYPDFVNPMLAALGLPVLCGLGNVATLAAGVAQLAFPDRPDDLQMLAHHRHLKYCTENDARMWVSGLPAPELTKHLECLRNWPRRRLNDLGATAGGRLVARLLAGDVIEASLPGVDGLVGGYPVTVALEGCRLNLPSSVTRDAAVEWQEQHALHEGVTLTPSGTIRFCGRVAAFMRESGVSRHSEVPVRDWLSVAERLVATREIMRRGGEARFQ